MARELTSRHTRQRSRTCCNSCKNETTWNRKSVNLKQTVKALGELCAPPPKRSTSLLLVEGFAIDAKPGFTDAIRRLFRIHQTPLSPTDVRDDLVKMGIGVGQVKSVVVHSYSFAPHGGSRRN